MNNEEKLNQFNGWLVSFQEDLVKIVGKHRYNHHSLNSEEIISEINLSLLKRAEKIVSDPERTLTSEVDFKKMAYAYARNYIKWTADGVSERDKKYNNNRSDGVVSSEDGSKTVFESVCDTLGQEDFSFEKLNDSDKFQNVLSWIFNYSHFLTPHQKNILELFISGKKLDQIGDLTGVSHQAISSLSIDMFNSIKSHIKIELNNEESEKVKIKDGYKAINYLFGDLRKKRRMDPKDLKRIIKSLTDNPKKHSLKDLTELFDGRYSLKQIGAYVNRNRYNKLLKTKSN